MILSARSCRRVLCQSCALYFLYFFEQCNVDSFGIIYPACRVRAGDNLCAHLLCLLCRIDCNITSTRYNNGLAFHRLAVTLHQFLCEIEQTISCCLCTCEGTAVCKSFTCEYALEGASDSLILSEHKADLSCARSDIARRNVHICANILRKLCHKALAECHDFPV